MDDALLLRAKGPRDHWFLGALPDMKDDPVSYLKKLKQEYGRVARFRIVNQHIYFVSSPAGIQHVLSTNSKNYTKTVRYKRLEPLLGKGLLTSEGEDWKRQRRTVQPAFHRKSMPSFVDLFIDRAHASCGRIAQSAGNPIDVQAEMSLLTFQIVLEALFGLKYEDDTEQIGTHIARALDFMNENLNALFNVPLYIPLARNKAFRSSYKVLLGFINRTIEENKANENGASTLLRLLLDTRDPETGQGMNQQEFIDQVMTFFFAGHETTSSALTWTLLLLALNQEWQERLYNELAPLSDEDLRGLVNEGSWQKTLLYAVIQESMRLYPPVGWIGRTPKEDDVIEQTHIPRGCLVFLSQAVTHRDPDFWQYPDAFNPERFMHGHGPTHEYAYFPFAAGPRVCIGKYFSLLELVCILPLIVRRFRISSENATQVRPRLGVTLRPEPSLLLKFSPR